MESTLIITIKITIMKTNVKCVVLLSLVCGLSACDKEVATISSDVDCSQPEQIILDNGLVFVKDGGVYRQDDMLYSPLEGTKGIFTNNTILHWPRGIVYYVFDSECTSRLINIATAAMNELSDSTGVQFLPASPSTSNYIRFMSADENSSYVGMRRGEQTINIYNDSFVYIIMHEICHALGIYHEQSRSDRDEYLIINWDNIKRNAKHNFDIAADGLDFGPFNFESIMLYSSWISDPAMVYSGSIPTITKRDGSVYYYNRSYLSHGDVNTVRAMYGPPFHRLEKHEHNVYESYSGYEDISVTEEADSLVFYADRACTTRQALPFPRLIRVESEHTFMCSGRLVTETTYDSIVVPAGTVSCLLWEGTNEVNQYAGEPQQSYDVTSLYISNYHVTPIWYSHY